MSAQRGVRGTDAAQRQRQTPSHVDPSALDRVGAAPRPTTQTKPTRQFARQRLLLCLEARMTGQIIEARGLVDIAAQLAQALLVLGACPAVEQLARVGSIDPQRAARELEHVQLASGLLEQ